MQNANNLYCLAYEGGVNFTQVEVDALVMGGFHLVPKHNIPLMHTLGACGSWLDCVEHCVKRAHPIEHNGISVHCSKCGRMIRLHLASRLDMNVSVLGHNDVPTPRFGRVYKIKNL